LQRTASEITPKPQPIGDREPSAAVLRSIFSNHRPMLPPGGGGTLARAEARIASAVATLGRVARPVVLELIEDEPTQAPVASRDGVVDSVRRLLGVRRTSRGALFVQPITAGERVSVAGSFNGWCAQTYPMRRNEALGVFELQIELGPGRHEYKLVIDGRWVPDPHNPVSRPDDFGGVNSIVELPDQRGV